MKKEDVIIALMKHIEPKKTFRMFSDNSANDFEGELKNNEFEIKRIINYRNSFLPIINGSIESLGYATRISVDMRIHYFTMIFMLVWCGFIGLMLILTLLNDNYEIASVAIPSGMLIFGYGLTIGGYLFEAKKAKDLLLSITQGRIVNE
ncbi:MAG: hypothetical protein QM734_16690 [Cyclobacteriaceae bacterium]